MKRLNLAEELSATTYPGRGIVIGRTPDGKKAAIAYFIMGRSENSRNRVFVTEGEGIRTEAFDPAKLEDPSLIIYAPVRVRGTDTIVTNGDQTDTIFENMDQGDTFEESLRNREFEPDSPNYTPRISGVLHIEGGYTYEMSILKSNNGDPDQCLRFAFSYDNPFAGEGHFIHTYIRVMRESLHLLQFLQMILRSLLRLYGRLLMKITRFRFSHVSSILRQDITRQES